MASLRCGFSCAHLGLAFDWKPCYTQNIGMAFPVWNDNSKWKWVKVSQHRAQVIKGVEFHAGWCKFYILSTGLQSVKTTRNDFQMTEWKLGKLWPDSFHFNTHLWINYLFQSFKSSHFGSLFFITWKVQKHKIPMYFPSSSTKA